MFANHYKHRTIRLYTAVFGTLFNEMQVTKGAKTITLPISYVGGDKSQIKNNEGTLLEGQPRIKLPLPRAAFRLTGWDRDPSRQTNKLLKIREELTQDVIDGGVANKQYNRVPFVFTYELYVKTKTIDELLQIVEQIAANFDPHVDVKVTDNPDVFMDSAIRIKLTSSSLDDEVDGSFEDNESHEVSFSFDVEGWLYKRTTTSKMIKTVDIEFHKLLDMTEEWNEEHIQEV